MQLVSLQVRKRQQRVGDESGHPEHYNASVEVITAKMTDEEPKETDALRNIDDDGTAEERPQRMPSFRVLVSHIDRANKMLLERVRTSTNTVLSSPIVRKVAPFLLIIVLGVYLFLGATAFFCFEHAHHDNNVRRFQMNLAVNRRHQARTISSRIFNDTRNLLIIIDRDQTERVQQILVDSLKKYENKLSMEMPDRLDWNFLNSFNYAYGLLLTLGHDAKIPETIGGQVFSLVYVLFGIPLFFFTIFIVVHWLVLPCWTALLSSPRKRALAINLSFLLFLGWIALLALFLYGCAHHDIWTSVYVAIFASLTIQVNKYSALSPLCFLSLLLMVTVSVGLLMHLVLLIRETCRWSKRERREAEAAAAGGEQPKFTVVIDEAGKSQLIEPSRTIGWREPSDR